MGGTRGSQMHSTFLSENLKRTDVLELTNKDGEMVGFLLKAVVNTVMNIRATQKEYIFNNIT